MIIYERSGHFIYCDVNADYIGDTNEVIYLAEDGSLNRMSVEELDIQWKAIETWEDALRREKI